MTEAITALVLFCVCLFAAAYLGSESVKGKYSECRKIASIETCIKHIGLEKTND